MGSARRALIVGALPPPSGGVATHCRELASELERQGVEVDLCDPRRLGPDGRDGRARLLYRLMLARARGDLVHVHTNGHNRGSWKLAALCGSDRSPSLLTLHSGLAPDFVRAHRAMVHIICKRYRHVVAVNPSIADALAGAGVSRAVITVCPAFSGSSLSFRVPPPGLAQIRRARELLIACALAPGSEYGAPVMLDAFSRVRARRPDAGLILYGPGTRAAPLVDAVETRDLRQSVYLLGELERERALAVVAAADVFVRPTLADGDAISVREAIALGRRVVASAVGSRPPEAALFPAGDAAACAEQIFQSLGQRLPQIARTQDCHHTILELYRHIGALPAVVANGTPLATPA